MMLGMSQHHTSGIGHGTKIRVHWANNSVQRLTLCTGVRLAAVDMVRAYSTRYIVNVSNMYAQSSQAVSRGRAPTVAGPTRLHNEMLGTSNSSYD